MDLIQITSYTFKHIFQAPKSFPHTVQKPGDDERFKTCPLTLEDPYKADWQVNKHIQDSVKSTGMGRSPVSRGCIEK